MNTYNIHCKNKNSYNARPVQNMYNRSISFKVLLKTTSYINDAIIDKQSSIN